MKSGRVVIVDAQTFLIPSFNYDGQAPDAHFWVGTGKRPGPEGTKIGSIFILDSSLYIRITSICCIQYLLLITVPSFIFTYRNVCC